MSRIYEAEEETTIPAGCYDAVCIEIEDPKSYGQGSPAFKFIFEFTGGHRVDALASATNLQGKLTRAMKVWKWKNALLGDEAPFDLDMMAANVPCCVEVTVNDSGYNAVDGPKPQYGVHAFGSRTTQQVPGFEAAAQPPAQAPAPTPAPQAQYAPPQPVPGQQSAPAPGAPQAAPVAQQQYPPPTPQQAPPQQPMYDANGNLIAVPEDPYLHRDE